jgi:hypothetical protein
MEKAKSYANKDLYNISEKDFCDLMTIDLKIDENDFISVLEWVLLTVNFKDSPMRFDEAKHIFNLNTFNGAWVMTMKILGGDGSNDFVFRPFSLQVTPDMFPNMNLKLLNIRNKSFQLTKFRILENKERRHIPMNKGFVMQERIAVLSKNEKWYTTEEYWEINRKLMKDEVSGHKYEFIIPVPTSGKPGYFIPPYEITEYVKNEETKKMYFERVHQINLAYNFKLREYYEWFVYIRENEKSVGIKIPILPEASKEVFALRNIPEGEMRRKAICNFVRQHYRTVMSSYSEEKREILVRKHLRGEDKFNWRGLEVYIIPAEYDVMKTKTKKEFIKINEDSGDYKVL